VILPSPGSRSADRRIWFGNGAACRAQLLARKIVTDRAVRPSTRFFGRRTGSSGTRRVRRSASEAVEECDAAHPGRSTRACHSEARPRRSRFSHQRLQGRGIYCRVAGGQTRQPSLHVRLRHRLTGPVPGRATGHQQQTVDFSVGAQVFVRADGAVWRLLRNDRGRECRRFLNTLSELFCRIRYSISFPRRAQRQRREGAEDFEVLRALFVFLPALRATLLSRSARVSASEPTGRPGPARRPAAPASSPC
jgi:hypothetical protein